MKITIVISVFLILFVSCNTQKWSQERRLDAVLSYAGDNRAELERFLAHYRGSTSDSLKYRAACFLVENMPGHYSYRDTAYLNQYYDEVDSVAVIYNGQSDAFKDSLFRQTKDKYNKQLEYIEDIHYITAEYLIDNIERSFDVWQNGRWATHVGFDDFCEYILPYKAVEGQTLDNWREYFSDYSNEGLQKIAYHDLYRNLAFQACDVVNSELRNKMHPRLLKEEHIPIRRMSTLEKIPFGLCDDYVTIATSVMRAKGIPVCIDFTPQWPFRHQGHNWNVLLENSGMHSVFLGADTSPGTPHKKDHTMGKVFRRTYVANREIQQIYASQEHVPPSFLSPFMKDVTKEYVKTTDVEITVSGGGHKYVYLSVFDNANWIPIHWAEVKRGKAVFKAMGRDIAYLPVAYGESGCIPIAEPFILNVKGEMEILSTVNNRSRMSMSLYRKFPVLDNVYSIMGGILDVEIQASNDPEFRDATTFTTIKRYGTRAEELVFETPERYRYWRFHKSTPGGGNFFIAEILFFRENSTEPSYGKIIGTEGSFWHNEDKKERAFDKDALTIFDAPYGEENWVGMDFGEAMPISKVVYYPRSDGNLIEVGDDYELVYWHNDGWESLGRQRATGAYLRFDHCPEGALFLLHNYTKGKEERIFTYENGEQVWW